MKRNRISLAMMLVALYAMSAPTGGQLSDGKAISRTIKTGNFRGPSRPGTGLEKETGVFTLVRA